MTTNSNFRVKNNLEFTNSSTGVTFADGTVQTTAYEGLTGFKGWSVDVGTLTAAESGKVVQIYGTVSLPLAGDCPEGGSFSFTNQSGDTAYVVASGEDFIYHNPVLSTTNTSITLYAGETLTLASRGPASNEWDVVDGTAVLKYQTSATVQTLVFPDGTIQTTAYVTAPPPPGGYPQVDYLIVAGGGGGGGVIGGGGGSGGFSTGTVTVTPTTEYTITVGAGGSGAPGTNVAGTNGGDTSFDTIATVLGGGGGAAWSGSGQIAEDGGSGGGGAGSGGNTAGGSGTAGQGNDGSNGVEATGTNLGGGGGGAGSAGSLNPSDGGAGLPNSYVGSEVYFAGGGGGGVWYSQGTAGAGGIGDGGAGGPDGSTNGGDGGADRGAGGGGAGYTDGVGFSSGGNGGNGIVIIRYASATQQATGGNVIDTYTIGDTTYWFHAFTTSGTFTA